MFFAPYPGEASHAQGGFMQDRLQHGV